MKLDEVDIEDLMHICQWILFHDKNLPFRDGEVTVNVVERAHAFSKLIDNNTCEKVRAGRRIMTIHEHRSIKDAFKSASMHANGYNAKLIGVAYQTWIALEPKQKNKTAQQWTP